jgi:hypothetical protein
VQRHVSLLRRPRDLLRGCAPLLVAGAVALAAAPAAATDVEPPSIRSNVSGLRGNDGWYRSDVTVRWTLSDPTGISSSDGCGPRSFKADTAGITIKCKATNGANLSRSASVTIRIDKTPPALSELSIAAGDGANVLQWKSPPDLEAVEIARVLRGAKSSGAVAVFRGGGEAFTDTGIQNGREYLYTLTARDKAGNASTPASIVALPKVLVLQKLSYVPRVSTNPVLRWSATPRAAYYHVQLFRHGKRILAAWPREPQLALRSTWSWRGRRYRLDPGTYRWYVWARVGSRSGGRYTRVGTAAFTAVTESSPASRYEAARGSRRAQQSSPGRPNLPPPTPPATLAPRPSA